MRQEKNDDGQGIQSYKIQDYYRESMSKAVDRARSVQEQGTVDLLFLTDPHHQTGGNQLRAAAAAVQAAGELSVDCIVIGGDLFENGEKAQVLNARSEFMQAMRQASCPVFPIQGNHDDNSIYDYHRKLAGAPNVLFPVETYEELYRDLDGTVAFDKGNETGMYSYYDIPGKRTRIVMLNSVDIVYKIKSDGMLLQNGQWEYGFSDRQVEWVESKALNFRGLPDGDEWRAVIFSHLPIVQRGVKGYVDGEAGNGEKLWKIIKQNRKHVAACLFGHVHIDQVLYQDGIPMISTLNAVSCRNYNECPERTVGTDAETAFDLVSIHYPTGELRMTRFGAGQDRIVRFEGSRESG